MENKCSKTQRIDDFMGKDESIIWKGKPKKNAYVWNKCIGFLPFVIIWLGIDVTMMVFAITMLTKSPDDSNKMIIPMILGFFAIHLIPVWIWLGQFIKASKSFKHAEYAVTNIRVIVKNGPAEKGIVSFYYNDYKGVELFRGRIDKMCGVGDILFRQGNSSYSYGGKYRATCAGIVDIVEYEDVFKKVKMAFNLSKNDISVSEKAEEIQNKVVVENLSESDSLIYKTPNETPGDLKAAKNQALENVGYKAPKEKKKSKFRL